MQLEDFHSLDRLGHKLVLLGVVLGVVAELVQLTRDWLAQLQLGVRAQDRDHVGEGHHRHLVQLKFDQLVQLQIDVKAHLDGVGGQRRCYPVLRSRQ